MLLVSINHTLQFCNLIGQVKQNPTRSLCHPDMKRKTLRTKLLKLPIKRLGKNQIVLFKSNIIIFSGYNHHMVTLYLNGNPPWLKVFGDDQKPRVVLVTVLTSLILLLYDGLMVSHLIFIFSGTYFFLNY